MPLNLIAWVQAKSDNLNRMIAIAGDLIAIVALSKWYF